MRFKSLTFCVLTVAVFLTCSLAHVSSIDAYVRVKRDIENTKMILPLGYYVINRDADTQNYFKFLSSLSGTSNIIKRERRSVGKCVSGILGGIASGATYGFLKGVEAGRSKGPQAAGAGGVIGATGGAIGGGFTGAAATCF